LIDDADMGRIAGLGLISSMQPLHATSDMLMAEAKWGARCRGAYAIRSQAERGVVLAFGSDCPVESPSPLKGIHAAVTRRRDDGEPGEGGWHPEQRISVRQAVNAYTLGPAFATGLEGCLGVLSPGYLADFVVLDRDIFSIDPDAIPDTQVLGTAVGGRFARRTF
jgi:predicted amidohydrolase YtcJ